MGITELKKHITDKLNTYLNEESEIELSYPQDFKNGQLSTNFALKNSKVLKKNPREIAEEIVDIFKEDPYIEEVSVAGPGFINFYINETTFKKLLVHNLNEELVVKQTNDLNKYNIEYISANPTGDLHLGHARIGVYADSTTRVMKRAGYDVSREYYINDAGAQMNNLGLSVKYFYLELLGIETDFPEDGYRGDEIKEVAKKLYDEEGEAKKDAPLEFFIEYGYKRNMEEINNVLAKLNITFDTYTSEKSYHDNGDVAKCLDVLNEHGDTYEEDGALWLNTTKYGDDKDRVIRKKDGSFTYLTSDIAYHLDKYNRGFDKIYDILGGDHHGYVARLKASIEALGKNPDDFDVSLVQMVNIVRNNETVKMSKRAGTSVTIKDLLKEIDSEAIRYFFVMRSPDTQLDFDLDVTTKRSSENPVYYIQYAHARISSILNTASEEGIKITEDIVEISEIEKQIIIKLNQYSEVVNEAALRRLPHMVANYLYELATLYHHYYNQERVFGENQNTKLNVNIAVKNVISDGLLLLGITAKEKM